MGYNKWQYKNQEPNESQQFSDHMNNLGVDEEWSRIDERGKFNKMHIVFNGKEISMVDTK